LRYKLWSEQFQNTMMLEIVRIVSKKVACIKATLCDFYPHLVLKRYMTIQ